MSCRSLLITLCLVTVALSPLAVHAEDTKSTKMAIMRLYASESRAMQNRDIQGVLAVYANSYFQALPNGKNIKLIKVQLALPKLFRSSSDLKDYFTVTGFAFYPDATIVTVRRKTVALLFGQANAKPKKFFVESVAKDRWSRSGDTWKLMSSKVLSIKQTVDGRVVPL